MSPRRRRTKGPARSATGATRSAKGAARSAPARSAERPARGTKRPARGTKRPARGAKRPARGAEGERAQVGIAGAGAAAVALARALAESGVRVELWARDGSRARRAASAARVGLARSLDELASAQLVLVCVTDRAIGEVAASIARAEAARDASGRGVRGGARRRRIALHTSGYHDASVLAPLAQRGWETGSMHPLIALARGGIALARGRADDRARNGVARARPSADARSAFTGATFAIEGTPRARRAATTLARALGARTLELAPDEKARYHAAAALLAGGLVVLCDAAEALLADGGVPRERARAALGKLASSVLANVAALGPRAALTGPAARGDREVLDGHLRALAAGPPGVRELYAELVEHMLALARARDAARPRG